MMYQLIIPAGSHAKEFTSQSYFIRGYCIDTDVVAYRMPYIRRNQAAYMGSLLSTSMPSIK
jgi:hypothetical protein